MDHLALNMLLSCSIDCLHALTTSPNESTLHHVNMCGKKIDSKFFFQTASFVEKKDGVP